MRKQFNLQDWLTDTSQKVVDENGRPVRIICTDADGLYPIIGLVDNKTPLPCGKDGRPPYIGGGGGTLFLVTPEPELSEFEKEYIRLYKEGYTDGQAGSKPISDDNLKECAAELLELAKKELCESGEVKDWYAKGKAEALRTRATELTKNLGKSGLDKDSIPYHLIEFMCNLYTCQNWKEIEETAEAYVTRIKAEALKDLPRWKKAAASFGNYSVAPTETGALCLLIDGHYIMLSELMKLPGFNE